MKKAQIITIGDEILIGQVIDSNSAWIASKLNEKGIEVHEIVSISDDKEHILQTLKKASEQADLLIVTGGLGPTKDDITKDTLCTYFNTTLQQHEPTLKHIRGFFNQRGMNVNELNKAQALIPANATPLFNDSGTAPGMWFEQHNTIYIFMPGVPYEMKSLMNREVLPRISNLSDTAILHKTVLTQGIAESVLAEKLAGWENQLPEKIKLAYLPRPGLVRLRLSTKGKDDNRLKQLLDKQIQNLKEIIPEYFFGYDEEKPEELIGDLLQQKGDKTVATAESCTGGAIASLITSIPGCSTYFKGSIVAYDNRVKINQLGVPAEMIEKHGAVSKPVVEAMAGGILQTLDADYAIATSGIAGPTGGTPDKPVGTVWIAVASKENNVVVSERYQFGENRERNITKSVMSGIHMLRKLLIT